MAVPMPTIAKPVDGIFRLSMGNYNQLIKFLDYVEDPDRSIKHWTANSDHQFYLTDEVTRLIFNFAVSAVTFVDLTNNLFKVLPKTKELEQLMVDYRLEKRKRFDSNSNYQVIDGLRHYLVHTEMIGIARVFEYDKETGSVYTLQIEKNNLIAGKGFNKMARKTLEKEPTAINIRVLVEECMNDLQGFHQWLWEKQGEILNNRNFYIGSE
ncbi:MAG: hypothetical protein EHM12_01525 [Dehalococcoidia bacterium]|nr:MAG: hypothetical protein EHM12_01525 [Dehalococcoidia bacterium]